MKLPRFLSCQVKTILKSRVRNSYWLFYYIKIYQLSKSVENFSLFLVNSYIVLQIFSLSSTKLSYPVNYLILLTEIFYLKPFISFQIGLKYQPWSWPLLLIDFFCGKNLIGNLDFNRLECYWFSGFHFILLKSAKFSFWMKHSIPYTMMTIL